MVVGASIAQSMQLPYLTIAYTSARVFGAGHSLQQVATTVH